MWVGLVQSGERPKSKALLPGEEAALPADGSISSGLSLQPTSLPTRFHTCHPPKPKPCANSFKEISVHSVLLSERWLIHCPLLTGHWRFPQVHGTSHSKPLPPPGSKSLELFHSPPRFSSIMNQMGCRGLAPRGNLIITYNMISTQKYFLNSKNKLLFNRHFIYTHTHTHTHIYIYNTYM